MAAHHGWALLDIKFCSTHWALTQRHRRRYYTMPSGWPSAWRSSSKHLRIDWLDWEAEGLGGASAEDADQHATGVEVRIDAGLIAEPDGPPECVLQDSRQCHIRLVSACSNCVYVLRRTWQSCTCLVC